MKRNERMAGRNPCAVGALLTVLEGPWTTYILWILSSQGPQRFGQLRRAIAGISAKVLTERLRHLEREGIVARDYRPTIPPAVTYSLTRRGCELAGVLDALDAVARRWYRSPTTGQDAA
ncbi:MAG TPA: helix-turn-helix domain-containing protein [Alphaproteobacteria bacterium]|nr:helix-turn-helix domain-containing protein [Alphaproteobacteria bacterium]